MQRIRGQFVALAKPAYADPDDPTVSPNLGYFNKDPGQANTPLNQDWANMVQEELCGAVVALGGTLDGEDDTQLATLMDQGAFTPILVGNQAGITYSNQRGFYARVGSLVVALVDIEWSNGDDAQNSVPAEIVPPFDVFNISGASFYVGALDHYNSIFGTQGGDFTTAHLSLAMATGEGIFVLGRATTMASTQRTLLLGDSNTRRVVGSIAYRTDGTFNY
jgi:hypothetical protein